MIAQKIVQISFIYVQYRYLKHDEEKSLFTITHWSELTWFCVCKCCDAGKCLEKHVFCMQKFWIHSLSVHFQFCWESFTQWWAPRLSEIPPQLCWWSCSAQSNKFMIYQKHLWQLSKFAVCQKCLQESDKICETSWMTTKHWSKICETSWMIAKHWKRSAAH